MKTMQQEPCKTLLRYCTPTHLLFPISIDLTCLSHIKLHFVYCGTEVIENMIQMAINSVQYLMISDTRMNNNIQGGVNEKFV